MKSITAFMADDSRWNWIIPVRKCAAVEIRFVRIIQKWNSDARLIIRNEDKIHLVKCPQCLARRRKVTLDLRDHGIGIRQSRRLRNVFVPRVGHGHNLHRRKNHIRCRGVKQDWRRENWHRPEDPAFLVDFARSGFRSAMRPRIA